MQTINQVINNNIKLEDTTTEEQLNNTKTFKNILYYVMLRPFSKTKMITWKYSILRIKTKKKKSEKTST